MKKIFQRVLPAAWAAFFLLSPAEAAAQWYAGAEAGMLFTTFRAEYAYRVGTPDAFVNRASGFKAGVLLGLDLPLSPALTLGVEIRSATSGARWEMDTVDTFEGTDRGGPARLRYEIPWNVRAATVLKLRVSPAFSFTGELGLGQGLVHEAKTSETSTSYDHEGWVPCLAAGAGAAWRLSPKLDVIARLVYAQYGRLEYTSHFPDGEPWETVSDRPSGLSARLGLLLRIGGRPD